MSGAHTDLLKRFTRPVMPLGRPLVGREQDMFDILDVFARPELCNVIVLAEAGTGKSALIQGLAEIDTQREYLEIDVSRLLASGKESAYIGAALKELFAQVIEYQKESARDLVLFVDEFHQLVMASEVGVEALKPLLASSARYNVRFIGATTYKEFHEYIAPNQALVERLWRMSLPELNREATIGVLKSFVDAHGVADKISEQLLGKIYDYTQLYVPENAQPRKSLLVLDAMVGRYRSRGVPLDFSSLADVLKSSVGVDIALYVDVQYILDELNKRVLAQPLAVAALEDRLNVCLAGLNDPSRPMASFLFTGSTGVGKTELAKQIASLLLGDSRAFVRLDMTEYASDTSMDMFRDELTRRVWERPHSVVLLDEVEKASGQVIRLLLQVLDDGRLLDRHRRIVPFTNAYIVLTTNAGSEVYEELSHEVEVSERLLRRYDRLIRSSIRETQGENRFPPELLGRIDEIVPFAPLSEETLGDIAFMKLCDVVVRVREVHGVEVFFGRIVHEYGNETVRIEDYADSLIDFLIGDDLRMTASDGGARRLVGRIAKTVVSPLAAFLNGHRDVRECVVAVEGELLSETDTRIESEARVRVVEKGNINAENG